MSQQHTVMRVAASAEGAEVQGEGPVAAEADGVRQKYSYLTDADKITLMKLCVEYQAEHKHGKKTAFWSMISEMLLQVGVASIDGRLKPYTNGEKKKSLGRKPVQRSLPK